jgi:hypothetical protein
MAPAPFLQRVHAAFLIPLLSSFMIFPRFLAPSHPAVIEEISLERWLETC